MNFSVKVNVKPHLGTILSGGGGELSKYNMLPDTARTAIVTETYQRQYLGELLGNSSNWERRRIATGGGKKKNEQTAFSMENEVLNNVFGLASKDKTTETVTVLEPSVKRKINIGGFEGVPQEQQKEKKVKKPNAKATVSFSFDTKSSVLIVEVQHFSVRDAATQQAYQTSLEKALKTAGASMERKLSLQRLVKPFFDTLHMHNLCYISGNEAINMMRIFRNAKVAYPNFNALEKSKQIDIMDRGYRKARIISSSSRDIHVFARATFEAIYEEKGLIDRVYKHDFVTNRMMTYEKVEEHRKNRVDPEHQNQIWEKGYLIFVDYVYGIARIRTSLSAFDLWDILAKGVRASDASF